MDVIGSALLAFVGMGVIASTVAAVSLAYRAHKRGLGRVRRG